MFNTQVKGDQSEIRTEGTRIALVNKVTHNLMPEPLNLRPPAVPSPQFTIVNFTRKFETTRKFTVYQTKGIKNKRSRFRTELAH